MLKTKYFSAKWISGQVFVALFFLSSKHSSLHLYRGHFGDKCTASKTGSETDGEGGMKLKTPNILS